MKITFNTQSRGQALDVTDAVNQILARYNCREGLCNLFVPHTTAAITVNEGFDPSVTHDVLTSLDKLFPWRGGYTHLEGNSAAHLKSIAVGVSLTLPVTDSRLALGQWQKIFFMEFDGPRARWLQISFVPSQATI